MTLGWVSILKASGFVLDVPTGQNELMLISLDITVLKPVIKSGLWPEDKMGGVLLCQLFDNRAFAHTNICTYIVGLSPLFPASLLTVLPDPRLCLSFFLRRRSIPQQPHPPHRAGPVPAAAHHRTASLVLPQVKSPTLRGLTHLTSPPHPLPSLGLAVWLWARLGGRAQGDKHFLL